MQAINKNQLFLASRIALIFTAMTFAFRAGLEGVWSAQFSLTKEQLGWIFSPAFYGFTLAMIFGGPLCDVIGMKRLLVLAFIGHLAGVIVYLTAKDATMLFVGTLCIGIGNGMVEAACNPLTVTLFPDNKTTMLNRFHVWFPGGIVIGGLLSYFIIDKWHLDWRILIALLFIPAVIYGFLFLKLKFPQTERVTKGVSTAKMFSSCLSPLFLIMLACMFLTAATELGTNQWLGALLQGAGGWPFIRRPFRTSFQSKWHAYIISASCRDRFIFIEQVKRLCCIWCCICFCSRYLFFLAYDARLRFRILTQYGCVRAFIDGGRGYVFYFTCNSNDGKMV